MRASVVGMSQVSSAAVADTIAQAVTEQTQELIRRLEGVRSGRARDVHRMRVASRRLREALAVIGKHAGPAGNRLRRRARRLTRALGEVRELDVSLQELSTAARRHHWPRTSLLKWRRVLGARRTTARRRLDHVLQREKIDAVGAAGKRVRAHLKEHAFQGASGAAALRSRIADRASDVVRAILACGREYDAVRLHQLRIAVKKLRYALELVPASEIASTLREHLRATQQQLGHWHDLHVLRELFEQAESHDRPSTFERSAAQAIAAECEALHLDVLQGLPALAVDVIRVRQSEVPDLGHRTPRRMLRSKLPSEVRNARRRA
jgi:CHAD domain-containing protein